MNSMEDAMRKPGIKGQGKQGRDRGRGDPNRQPRESLPQFPNSYFGVDTEGRRYLQPVFVSKQSVDPLARILGQKLTTGQMRRFFNHCREIERRLSLDGQSWDQVSAQFEALCYHAQNAQSAGKIPRDFQNFVDENVSRVISSEEPETAFLDGFLPHFEALVGFGAAYLKKEGK